MPMAGTCNGPVTTPTSTIRCSRPLTTSTPATWLRCCRTWANRPRFTFQRVVVRSSAVRSGRGRASSTFYTLAPGLGLMGRCCATTKYRCEQRLLLTNPSRGIARPVKEMPPHPATSVSMDVPAGHQVVKKARSPSAICGRSGRPAFPAPSDLFDLFEGKFARHLGGSRRGNEEPCPSIDVPITSLKPIRFHAIWPVAMKSVVLYGRIRDRLGP